jgi:hypothetical protein
MAREAAPRAMPGMGTRGLSMDSDFSPVRIPRRQRRDRIAPHEVGRVFSFDMRPESSTYLLRGEVEDERALGDLIEAVERDSDGVGVFADAQIAGFAGCASRRSGIAPWTAATCRSRSWTPASTSTT